MSERKENESIAASIKEDRDFIRNWSIKKIDTKPAKPPTDKKQGEPLPQDQLAESYYQKIDQLNEKLGKLNITSERKNQLSKNVTRSSFAVMIIAPLMALISFFVVIITSEAWTALTNVVSAIPPFFVTLYKGKLDSCYAGSHYQAKLSVLRFKIELALKRGELKDKVVQEVEATLFEYEEGISKLSPA